jgi:hypothetical protein
MGIPKPHDRAQVTYTLGEIASAEAVSRFYASAAECMEWAKASPCYQQRALYVQMALKWLAAGARLQTFLQLPRPHTAASVRHETIIKR